MKGKMGILMVIFCIISFLLYRNSEKRRSNAKIDKIEKIIQGKVVSAIDNIPIEGVTIAFQGENYKTVTNGLGEYAIFTRENQELVFRHNNFKTTVVVAKDAKIVKMEPVSSDDIQRINDALPKTE